DGERLLEVGAGVRALELVDVDVVGAEAAQRALDGSGDPAAGATLQVRPLAHRQTDLGGEDHLVAAPLERSPDDLLRVAVAVRGVDEVDPRVQRLVDDPDRLVRVVAHLAGEHQGAECVGADLDAGPPERAVLHKRAPSVRGGGQVPPTVPSSLRGGPVHEPGPAAAGGPAVPGCGARRRRYWGDDRDHGPWQGPARLAGP